MDKLATFPSATQRVTLSPRRLPKTLDGFFKRGLDILGASIGLLLLALPFLYIALRIKRDSPGPVFYRGARLGKDEREFRILKFRTMREIPESYAGPRVTAHDDPRVTPLGRWLRDSKINELPQLWNVLVGEMSLVGPRPEDPAIVRTWSPPTRYEIFSVRPGITSPASVIFRDEESRLKHGSVMEEYLQSILPSKLRLDQLYIHHRSFWLDLNVLLMTVKVLVPLWQDTPPSEEMLFLGPITRLGQRYLNWFIMDALITLLAVSIAGGLWRLSAPLDLGLPLAFAIAVGLAFLFSLTNRLLRVYQTAWSNASAGDAWWLAFSTGSATACAIALNANVFAAWALPHDLILLAAGLAFAGFVVARYRMRLLSGGARRWLAMADGARAARERVLIVGGGYAGQFVTWLLGNAHNANAFHIVGFVDDDLFKQVTRLQGVQVIGRRADIPRLVQQHDVGIIFFAIHNITPDERQRLLQICMTTSARVIVAPDILGSLNALISERDANGHAAVPLGFASACEFCPSRPASELGANPCAD